MELLKSLLKSSGCLLCQHNMFDGNALGIEALLVVSFNDLVKHLEHIDLVELCARGNQSLAKSVVQSDSQNTVPIFSVEQTVTQCNLLTSKMKSRSPSLSSSLLDSSSNSYWPNSLNGSVKSEDFDSELGNMVNLNLKVADYESDTNERIAENQLDHAARLHRFSASSTATDYKWSGVLAKADLSASKSYSVKVFIGGLPWGTTESSLIEAFKKFGTVRVEWPGKENSGSKPKGFAYLIFEHEFRINELLKCCTIDSLDSSKRFYRIPILRKHIEVVPWPLADSNYHAVHNDNPDSSNTIFVGALHGLLNASHLAKIMSDLFGPVIFIGLDTDRYHYPIGSGRVVFQDKMSYSKAVSAGYVEIKSDKFFKKIQIDPYLEEKLCFVCGVRPGIYFCRQVICFNYYCRQCWKNVHDGYLDDHQPIMRKFN